MKYEKGEFYPQVETAAKKEFPGVTIEQIVGLGEIFSYFDRIEVARMYGSRVVGGFRDDSDLDIVFNVSRYKSYYLSDIVGSICSLSLERLGLDLHLKIFEEINNPDLIDKIERTGVIIYTKGGNIPH